MSSISARPDNLTIDTLLALHGPADAYGFAEQLRLAAVQSLPPWPGAPEGICPGLTAGGDPCEQVEIVAVDLKESEWQASDLTSATAPVMVGSFDWSDGDGDHLVCRSCGTRWAMPEEVVWS